MMSYLGIDFSGLNYAYHGLSASVNVHVLDGNLLLPLPSIALQRLGLGREGSQKFHGQISVAVLLGYHVRPLQTAQGACRSKVRGNHLDCQHRLDFVVRPDPMNRREYSVDVLLTWRMTGGAITGRIDEAIEQKTHNTCFRCPERQRQARAVGRRVTDCKRLVRFGFDDQARRARPAVASLEEALENCALLRRWRGFRPFRGALWVGCSRISHIKKLLMAR
jgi:hypothetical protein